MPRKFAAKDDHTTGGTCIKDMAKADNEAECRATCLACNVDGGPITGYNIFDGPLVFCTCHKGLRTDKVKETGENKDKHKVCVECKFIYDLFHS